jgi:carboxymethylenebutenolidase
MSGQDISIRGGDGEFFGYLAKPASGSGPGVVVIQEIFGVNDVMRQVADTLAAAGFFALAPDLFWRLEPGIQLTDKTDAEWQTAFGLLKRFDADKGVTDIQASITRLRGLPGVSGKVGAVGYCLGGRLATMTAMRTDSDASVGYYGIMLDSHLGEAGNIKKPLMLHIAEEDEFMLKPVQAKIKAGLEGNALVTIHSYPGMDHAFARAGGKHYDKAAADLADGRTLSFFRRHLT